MKLPEYAKRVGVTRFTAHRWFHEGRLKDKIVQSLRKEEPDATDGAASDQAGS